MGTTETTVRVDPSCGCFVAAYRPGPGNDRSVAVCDAFGHSVDLARDVVPHLDANEVLTWRHQVVGGIFGWRLHVTTLPQACEICGTLNDHHFTIRSTGGAYVPCPNDTTEDDR